MKLCNVYNFAAHYRTSIFVEMDRTFECDWYFGTSIDNIKKMDYKLLMGKVTELETLRLGPFSWFKGILGLLRSKDYGTFLILGQTKDVSIWVFCLAARLFYPRKRVYFWTHGWYGKENAVEKLLKKLFFRLPNGGIFLYGNYARDLMIKEGFNGDKLFVIHNSLAYEKQVKIRQKLKPDDVYMHRFGNDYPNLVFIGRLTKVKHLDLLLKSLKQLKTEGRQFNLTLIGGGEQQDELRVLVNEFALEESVWFYGPCYDEDKLGNLIYNADLCVSPGNVGLTAMHSMVFGTPVLTHNDFAWQMPEFEAIKEGVTGGFFVRDDMNSLADRIIAWFSVENYDRERIRQNCFMEIDQNWTPQFQIGVLKKHLL